MMTRRRFALTVLSLTLLPVTALAQQTPEITVYLNPG